MFLRAEKRILCVFLVLLCGLLAADGRTGQWTRRKTVMAVSQGVSLCVEELSQYPNLPNGCEATSLTAVLRFLGYDAQALELMCNYIPNQPITYSPDQQIAYGPDPAEAYAGWPEEGYTGFYCFAGPLVQGANAYLANQGSDWRAVDISGASALELMRWLDEGTPVIVWATLNMEVRLFSNFQWILPSGETYYPYSNLHCMVLTGYEGNTFTFMDPIEGTVTADRDLFMRRYRSIGQWAVAVEQS